MTKQRIYNRLLIVLFSLAPIVGFSQTASGGPDLFLKITFGFVAAIVLGGLVTVLGVDKALMDLQFEREGILEEKNPKSLWQRWKEKLLDIVPVEKESDILLHHNYDGIEELDNSLPPWWLYGFYISIIFGFGYLGYYHYYDYGLSSTEAYEHDVRQAQISVNKYLERQSNTIDVSNLIALTDSESLSHGTAIFNVNCIACHLKGGGGSPTSVGPNLTDDYWIHGGDIKSIFKTVKYGVPEKGMIAWKAQLKPADIHKVSSYILSLQGTNPPNAKGPQGDKYIAAEEQAN